MLITGPGGRRQGNRRADDPPVEPARQGAFHRRFRGDDEPRPGRGGAVRQRESTASHDPGLLEQAHGGTLFLDEIADMPLTTQAKILRVLTDQSYHRIGGQRPIKVDVRVLSATSRNLADEIAGGPFPRGPLLSAERRSRAHPGSARAAGGHPRARQSFPDALRRRAADHASEPCRMRRWRRCRRTIGPET